MGQFTLREILLLETDILSKNKITTMDADGGVWKASPIRTIVENLSGWEMLCLVSQPIATDRVFWSLHPQEEASENALGWVWRPSLQAETDGPRNLDP